jgi:peptidoglycan/xylan/chitin deacetylase (PgdA/CDA1 family)
MTPEMPEVIIPVLLYHSVSDGPALGGSWGAVSRARFETHVEMIAASSCHSLTISALASMLRGECPLVERPLAVTFDDGYNDTYAAVEALRRRGLCSTVYVTTNEIGTADRLSPDQVASLAELPGVEVGAHGVRHLRLDELDDIELENEVKGSKRRLERMASKPIESFAYPHGAYDRRVRAAVIDAGYRSATSVKNAVSHPEDDVFAIARVTVTGTTSVPQLAEVLEGRGVPLAWRGERARTRAYRIARRSRRRLRPAGSQPC